MASESPPDAAIVEIKTQQRAAYDANDTATLDLYLAIERELTQLRAVARAAARVYEDALDTDAMMALFDALSDAGML